MKVVISSLLTSLALVAGASAAADKALDLKVDTRPVTASDLGPVVSYADVLEQATPSVVAVYTSQIISVVERPQPRTLRELYEYYYSPYRNQPQPDAPVREERQPVGAGSGVIVSESGYVVTNNHVVRVQNGEVADEIRVRLSDDREYLAELIGTDEKTDIAVLKIEDEKPFPAVTIADSELLRVGDVVFAIGNPLSVGLTATQGIVSATSRELQGKVLGPGSYEDFIQTDAAINPGNSGGALIDARGRLIGINTAIVSGDGGNIGIGLAIPVNLIRNVMTSLIEIGEVPRGLLGLFPGNLSREMAEAFGLDSTHGALVNQVQPGSPAEAGGIRHGDVIIQVDDIEIISAPQLRLVISQMLPGTEVQIQLVRNGDMLTRAVVLGSLNGRVVSRGAANSGVDMSEQILEGVSLEPLSDRLRDEFSVPAEVEGIVVTDVTFESPYMKSVAKGMVILEVNGEAVRNLDDVQAHLKKGANRLYTWAGGNMGFVLLRVK